MCSCVYFLQNSPSNYKDKITLFLPFFPALCSGWMVTRTSADEGLWNSLNFIRVIKNRVEAEGSILQLWKSIECLKSWSHVGILAPEQKAESRVSKTTSASS